MSSRTLSRREFMRLSLAGGGALVLAGCAPAAPSAPAAPAAPGATSAPAPAAQAPASAVHLRFQAYTAQQTTKGNMWDEFSTYFHDLQPNIDFEWIPSPGDNLRDAIVSQMVAGQGPDVYQLCCNDTVFFIQNGQALNLQPYIDKDAAEVNLKDYSQQQFDPWKDAQGNIYFMPYYNGTMVVYYNKDMFDEVGVPYPSNSWDTAWSVEDYRAVCKKFVKRDNPTRFGTTSYGFGTHFITDYWLRAWGAHMVDPTDPSVCAMGSDKALQSLEFIRQMIWEDHGYAHGQEMGGLGTEAVFQSGKSAMMEMGSWALIRTVTGAKFNWDLAPMFKGPAGLTTHQSTDGEAIWSKGPHLQESWEFLKAIASPFFGELVAKYENRQPARISVLPKYITILRSQEELYNKLNLELFTDVIAKNIGGTEEMFTHDDATKNQIIKPAVDQVFLQNSAPVELFAKYAEVATKFNQGEIKQEDIQKNLDSIKL